MHCRLSQALCACHERDRHYVCHRRVLISYLYEIIIVGSHNWEAAQVDRHVLLAVSSVSTSFFRYLQGVLVNNTSCIHCYCRRVRLPKASRHCRLGRQRALVFTTQGVAFYIIM